MLLQGQAPLLGGRLSSCWEAGHHFLLQTFLMWTTPEDLDCFARQYQGQGFSSEGFKINLKSWIVPEQLHGPRHEVFVIFLWSISSSFILSWCHNEDIHLAAFGTCESAVELPRINLFAVCWARVQWNKIQKKYIKAWWKWSSIQFDPWMVSISVENVLLSQ